MRTILGIDPGTLTTGYGIVGRKAGQLRLIACGTITNRPADPMPQRLLRIHRALQSILAQYAPDEVAVESSFYGKNVQSALKLGHARGVSLLAAVEGGLPTAEYSPREVKLAVSGRGNATKKQVQFMVRSILGAPRKPMVLDASDALAVAICHLQRGSGIASHHKNWKSFLAEHPERIRA